MGDRMPRRDSKMQSQGIGEKAEWTAGASFPWRRWGGGSCPILLPSLWAPGRAEQRRSAGSTTPPQSSLTGMWACQDILLWVPFYPPAQCLMPSP